MTVQTASIETGADPGQKKTDRLYRIACTFPVLRFKGVEQGAIAGITPDGFNGRRVHDFLYHGGGGRWSSGEVLVLEFLLNLYDPLEYKGFNFGRAMSVWDGTQMATCLRAVANVLNVE